MTATTQFYSPEGTAQAIEDFFSGRQPRTTNRPTAANAEAILPEEQRTAQPTQAAKDANARITAALQPAKAAQRPTEAHSNARRGIQSPANQTVGPRPTEADELDLLRTPTPTTARAVRWATGTRPTAQTLF